MGEIWRLLTDNLNEYLTLADPVCDDAGVDYAVTI